VHRGSHEDLQLGQNAYKTKNIPLSLKSLWLPNIVIWIRGALESLGRGLLDPIPNPG
jgi:hypothetical protein